MKCPKLKPKQIQELNELINNSKSSGREVRRAQVVLLLDAETKSEMITALTGYSRRQSFDLRHSYLQKGIEGLKDKRKGKPKELLTKKQREEVIELLKTKSPKDYHYDWDYWTTGIIGDLIKRQYNVQYKSKTSFYIILRQAKFTYHKPGRVYHERNEEEVKEWQKSAKPKLEKALPEENTIILTEDEMILSTQTTFQKIWLPQGEYPKIEISNKRQNRSIYGFLNIKTGQEHAFKTKWQNMYITVKVLKELRKIYPLKRILIFWDGAGWHRGSKVQEFIQKDQNIETIYFPRYAPEENPQEHVWKNGRSQVANNQFIKNIDRIANKFVQYLNASRFTYSLLGWSADS